MIEAIADKDVQEIQASLYAGETRDLERMQHFGFSSVPPSGSEGVCVFPGGDREAGVCVADSHPETKPVDQGEGTTCIYDKNGSKIFLDGEGKILIESDNLTIAATGIEFGAGTVEALLKGETFQSFFNSHTHTGNTGAPTSPPINPSIPAHLTTVTKAE